jgi:putative FmdB family regulatory protein
VPIYEYECTACSAMTSTFVRGWNAPETVTCSRCGSTDTHRIISGAALKLGPLNENKGKPSQEAVQAAEEKKQRDIADRVVQQVMKRQFG